MSLVVDQAESLLVKRPQTARMGMR